MQILAEFRDSRLLSSAPGRRFVELYYKYSHPLADYLRQHHTARTVVRYALIPITGIAYLALHVNPLILLAAFVFLGLTVTTMLRRL